MTVPSLVWDEKYIRIINPNTAVMKCHSRNSAVLHDCKPITAAKQIWDSYFENGIPAAKSNSFSHSSQCRRHFLTHASSFLLWFLSSYKAGNKGPWHYIRIPGCTCKGGTGKKSFLLVCKLSTFDGDVHPGVCKQRMQGPLASLHSVTFLAVSQR